jgi:Luciferase
LSENISIHERIARAVTSWPDVESAPHRFGGVEFRLGKRELGHLHGDSLADLPFPRKVRDELIAAGRAQPHHVLPESGWVSFRIESPDDVDRAIALFRLGYERALAARARVDDQRKPKTSSGS